MGILPKDENLDEGIRLLQETVETLVKNLCGLHENIGLLTAVLRFSTIARKKQVDKVLNSKAEKIVAPETNETMYKIPELYLRRFWKLIDEHQFSHSMLEIIPSSIFVTMISQYDAFIGCLIKSIFLIKPETFNASANNKTISVAELMAFESIDEAKQHLLENQIESVLRDSHLDQIQCIKKIMSNDTFDLKPPVLNQFVEITQRRHLFVHNDGKVSKQYRTNCKKSNCYNDSLKIGDKLLIDHEYLNLVKNTLSEVSFLLSYHVFNLKYKNKSNQEYLKWLNDFSMSIISREDYQLAEIIIKHMIEHKYSDMGQFEEYQLFNILNYAQVLKWQSKDDEMKQVLKKYDWTTKDNVFKLAFSVLIDDLDVATTMMKKIGVEDVRMPKSGYLEWPIFKEFRKSEKFIETFKDIYKEDPTIHEMQYEPINEEITNKLREML